jgi:hypothetical protein
LVWELYLVPENDDNCDQIKAKTEKAFKHLVMKPYGDRPDGRSKLMLAIILKWILEI